MPLKSIVGLDHVVAVVRDLDAAAAQWHRLGFTVSPRGTHSAHMGTGNYTIMLGEDYIELLGVLTATERNAATRAYLERREGLERVAFTTTSAAALADEIAGLGLVPIGPTDFSRPVDLADGRKTEARFRTTQWPVAERPADLRIFACEHLTRDAVWLPELQRHANTARRIAHLEMVTPDPRAAAEHLARMIGQPVSIDPDGAIRVASGGTRADFLFVDQATLVGRHPGVDITGIAAECAITLSLVVGDDEAAAAALTASGVPFVKGSGSVKVAPKDANGVLLELALA
jgi:hypothetical protein